MNDISEERSKIEEYLKLAEGHFVEETDKSYQFMTQSMDQFNQVKGFMFLMGLNVGEPKDSSLIPSWKFGRIYKQGNEVDDEEEGKF